MKTIAVALLLLSANNSSFASDWKYVGGNATEYSQIDVSSISTGDRFRKAWVQTTYFSPQSLSDRSGAYLSDRGLYYFECAAKTIGSVQQIRYAQGDGAGDVVSTRSVKFQPSILVDVVPDSKGELFMKLVCSDAAGREKMIHKLNDPFEELMKKANAGR